jgi:hypothetical protein
VACLCSCGRYRGDQTLVDPHVILVQGSPGRAYYRYSSDQGASFSTAIAVDNGSGLSASNVRVAVDKERGLPHVLVRQTDGSFNRAYYNRSADRGRSFLGTTRVDYTLGDSVSGINLFVDSSGNPHVFLEQLYSGLSRFFYTYSNDKGASFSTPVIIDANTGSSFQSGKIVMDTQNRFHIVYVQTNSGVDRAYYTRVEFGASNGPLSIDTGATTVNGVFIALDSANNPNIVFAQTAGTNRIYFTRSSDGGATFSTPTIIDAATGSSATNGQIAVSRNNVLHTIFRQSDGSYNRIYYRYSTDGGSVFSTPVRIDAGTGFNASSAGVLVNSAGNPFINLAQLLAGVTRFYTTFSQDGGSNFSTPNIRDVSSGSSVSSGSALCDGTDRIHVTWVENSHVYYRVSSDSGLTFPSSSALDDPALGTATTIDLALSPHFD